MKQIQCRERLQRRSGPRGRFFRYHDGLAEADAEAVSGVRVGVALESKSNGAASVAGNVEVVAATANGVRIGRVEDRFFMATFRVEVIKHNFPDTTAHVSHAETVATAFSVMIDG
jgi:hypothetical protein